MKRCVLIGLSLVLISGCKKDPPLVPEPTLSLTAVDASCIEAWLRVTAADIPTTVRLLRDGQRVSDLRLLTSDTLLIDEGLLPRRTYTYQLHKLAADSTVIETSASVQVTTMDTTSHNFTWQIDTLGVTSSVLYDVAIISDTNIWAVGELFLRDSSGVLDPRRYNLARWDGTAWTIERLMYQGSPPVLRSIFAFTENDIWLDPWFHWNGQSFLQVPIDPIFIGVGVNKMWGSTDGRLYVVGNGGFIAERSPAGTWRQLESGATADVQDVWGNANRFVGGKGILLPASNTYSLSEKKLLRVNAAGLIDSLLWGRQDRRVRSTWYDSHSKVFACGGGVFAFNGFRWREYVEVPLIFTERIRGTATNNIVVVGDFGLVAHYNGMTWKVYAELGLADGAYYGLAIAGRYVVGVGQLGNRGIVLRGSMN